MAEPDAVVEAWIRALIDRHTATLRRPEFLKAVRALSVRYVERRHRLSEQAPLDSAGKRAAFAGFYAPLHFLVAQAVVAAWDAAALNPRRLIDLGCGTGVASAAWAIACAEQPAILGVDRDSWALREAAWNWRQLGVAGRTRRGNLVDVAEVLAKDRRLRDGSALVLAWSVNEIDDRGRRRLLPALRTLGSRAVPSLVIEPIARAASPWWDEWTSAAIALGGQVTERRVDSSWPTPLATIDADAGFRREGFAVRALWLGPRPTKS
jgi:hypothetical protein